jgi:hypothetical protein
MSKIEREIHDLEQRMARRRHEVADSARLAKQRAVRRLASPAGLAVAAGLGFLVSAAVLRKRARPPDRRKAAKPGKVAGMVSLLMPVVVGLIRAQFGSPAAMAQYVLSLRKRASPAGDAHPAAAPAAARTALAPRTVHPAR